MKIKLQKNVAKNIIVYSFFAVNVSLHYKKQHKISIPFTLAIIRNSLYFTSKSGAQFETAIS